MAASLRQITTALTGFEFRRPAQAEARLGMVTREVT